MIWSWNSPGKLAAQIRIRSSMASLSDRRLGMIKIPLRCQMDVEMICHRRAVVSDEETIVIFDPTQQFWIERPNQRCALVPQHKNPDTRLAS
jgi:hypothetical protein